MPELVIAPSGQVVFAAFRKVVARDRNAVSFSVELEENVSAAKDEEVRVLRDDCVDEAALLEVRKLRVGFVRRDDVLQRCSASAQSL